MAKEKDAGAVAYIYAQALYDVASEAGVTERVEEEIRAVLKLAGVDRMIGRFFESPVIDFADKERVVRKVLVGFHPLTVNFMLTALRKKRIPWLLQEIEDAFHDICNVKKGIAELKLRSAHPLDETQRKKLVEVLERRMGRTVVLLEEVQPELLGGFVLTHADREFNGAVIHKLGRLIDTLDGIKIKYQDVAQD